MPKPLNPTVNIRNLSFSFDTKPLLEVEDFQIQTGEQIAVIGPSGCGKTTLMHLISGLLRPKSGLIELQGKDTTQLKEWEMDKLRGREIGIVFQRLHLFPAISVLNNLLLAQRLARTRVDKKEAGQILDRLGIGDQIHALPSNLSQGQAQRAAIARAVIHKPSLLIGDEPTSALDNENAIEAIELLKELSESSEFALMIVTHDERVRSQMSRVLDLGATT